VFCSSIPPFTLLSSDNEQKKQMSMMHKCFTVAISDPRFEDHWFRRHLESVFIYFQLTSDVLYRKLTGSRSKRDVICYAFVSSCCPGLTCLTRVKTHVSFRFCLFISLGGISRAQEVRAVALTTGRLLVRSPTLKTPPNP